MAIKVLPSEFSQDAERLARFKREAKVLASLNHPGIAAIHGLEESEGTHYLVLELVPGETLAARIARGPIPAEEALQIAVRIAEALEEAHEQGIVHRDLKPANIMLTPDGKVVVLDFGLAKAFVEQTHEADSSLSPTLTRDATRVGVILGTAAYMSPEQAKGKDVDKRTDIFAFGAVLYEMLTGKKAFPGEDVSEVFAAVITLSPDWEALPQNRIADLLRRCLDKDLRKRFRDIGDVWYELEQARDDSPPSVASAATGLPWRIMLPLLLVVAVLAWGAAAWYLRSEVSGARRGVKRFVVEAGRLNPSPHTIALSPDGSTLVYAGYGESSGLHRRAMDGFEWETVAGTERESITPVFSPDGQWIGFVDYESQSVKKVAVEGGVPVSLYRNEINDTTFLLESWPRDNYIVVRTSTGFHRIAASGGAPEPLFLFPQDDDNAPSRPSMLPGSKALLFSVNVPSALPQIVVQTVGAPDRRTLLPGSEPTYLPSGHIVFVRDNSLWAVPFDAQSLSLTGEAVPLSIQLVGGGTEYVVSSEGTLAYVPRDARSDRRTLVWVDRHGMRTRMIEEENAFEFPRLSPDDSRVAVRVGSPPDSNIWVYDVERGTRTRVTANGTADDPEWTPDGTRILFAWSPDQTSNSGIYSKRADGSGEAALVLSSSRGVYTPEPSPDGLSLAYVQMPGAELWIAPAEGEPAPFLNSGFAESSPVFSPDGRFLAYVSDESGQPEVYVRPFPDGPNRWTISTAGGAEPLWSPDGSELFYRNGDEMMVVAIETEPELALGVPRALFRKAFRVTPDPRNYDVSSDGQRFVMVEGGAETTEIRIVLNWFEELERLAPSGN